MSDLMFEPTGPLQQWQKWANLARLEAIRADEAERECDELRARVNELSVHLEMCADVDTAHCIEIVEQGEQIMALLKALKAVEWVEDGDMAILYCPWCGNFQHVYPFGHASDCQRQAAIAAVEGE